MYKCLLSLMILLCLFIFNPLVQAETKIPAQEEMITLNFQNVSVRSVLQVLAKFMDKNVIISNNIQGNITLHMEQVSWKEALDMILKTQGLVQRDMGNVIIIAPAKEVIAQDKEDLTVQAELKDLVPLETAIFQIKYASANDYYTLLKDPSNTLLSPRGRAIVDKRTNILFVEDTPQKLLSISAFIKRTDIPVRQVDIEARIVTLDKTYERQLGINWSAQGNTVGALNRALTVDLGAQNIDGLLPGALSVATISSNILIGLELSALEAEGVAEVLSSPHLLTADQQEALIEQGQELPYNESTSSGAAAIAFKQAVLRLKVTPQITPDDKILLHLDVNQDALGQQTPTGLTIDTRHIASNVLVNNGETVVLGGIVERTKTNTTTRIPFLSALPLLGTLFEQQGIRHEQKELLIFVTPRIVEEK
jgi:type IV pilus assembly protein PilQ